MARQDNIQYDCGHTGHVVLPTWWDSAAKPIPAQTVIAHDMTARFTWNCPSCDQGNP
ncbi:hypothetical protein LCGC14_1105990 [marine sediment metagenome]|uniref:Uncharacterized protein n=1 Tax=marine sediment metagenome TaxID=412755 RepID=A0A0F9PRA0_9ZZZZ